MGGASFIGSMRKDTFIFQLFKVPNHSQLRHLKKIPETFPLYPLFSCGGMRDVRERPHSSQDQPAASSPRPSEKFCAAFGEW